jgi:hypothetical protein
MASWDEEIDLRLKTCQRVCAERLDCVEQHQTVVAGDKDCNESEESSFLCSHRRTPTNPAHGLPRAIQKRISSKFFLKLRPAN